ncbi:uncharacterized protein [Dysidea avara]|uniref:uncharacterized protein isoform X2 n=1 Tax=Dysidea avara TaxID=196820 RepID=UPI00332569A9
MMYNLLFVAEEVVCTASHMREDGVLIKVAVQDINQWADPSNVFKLTYKIKCLPALVNINTGYKLEGENCCKELLVRRVLGVKMVVQPKSESMLTNGLHFTSLLNNVDKEFDNLSKYQKEMVLFNLHKLCAPFKCENLASTLDKLSKRDFLSLLPPEIAYKILEHLDHSSLGCSAVVSRVWYSLVTSNHKLWLKAIDSLTLHEELKERKLKYVQPYRLYVNYKRKLHYFKHIAVEMHFPDVKEFVHSGELQRIKEIRNAPDGSIALGHSMAQPHDIFRKYRITSSSKLLSTIKTIHTMSCRVNNKFLFCSSIGGRWMCYDWKTGKEVYTIQTRDYGYDERSYAAFADPCNKCCMLGVFSSNRVSFTPNGDCYCAIKFVVPYVNEYCELQVGIRIARFMLDATEQLNIIYHHAVVSEEIKFYCGNEKSSHMPCEKHKMIFQQQDFQVFIYEMETRHEQGPCSLLPVLLYRFKPDVQLDIPQEAFGPHKFCLSKDMSIMGYASGPKYVWYNVDGKMRRNATIEGDPFLTVIAIGDVFSILAVVTTEFFRLLIVESASGKIVKVFPDLTPTQGWRGRSYDFTAAPLDVDWLNDITDSPELFDKTVPMLATVYGAGVFVIWHCVP